MASAEREPIYMGVWGLAPSGVQGQSPLVRGSGSCMTRFCIFKFKFLMKNAPFIRNLNRSKHAENINSIYNMPVCW